MKSELGNSFIGLVLQENTEENEELQLQVDLHAERLRRAKALLQPSKRLPSSLLKDAAECPVCMRCMQPPLQVKHFLRLFQIRLEFLVNNIFKAFLNFPWKILPIFS